jgi:predicted ArsR family transcriptional regulator
MKRRYVTDEEILALFEESDDPFVTIPEIAEQVDLTTEAVRYRLKKLRNEGVVESKNVTAQGWWLA